MFSRKPQEPLPDFSHVQVKLKPILGLAPGVYLTTLYGLGLLVILFFVLVFPGLRAFGTNVTFKTYPEGAGIWIDGRYRGVSPCEVFVSAGERNIEFKKAFYATAAVTNRVRGRVFGSLFVPLRSEIRTRLAVADIDALLAWAGQEWAEWGMLREFSRGYRLPRTLSDAVRAVAAVPPDERPRIEAKLYSFLYASAFFVDSPLELREFLRALAALAARERVFAADSLGRMLNQAARFTVKYPSFFYWLAYTLPSAKRLPSATAERLLTAEKLRDTEAFQNLHRKHLDRLDVSAAASGFGPQLSQLPLPEGFMAAGVLFVPVPAGAFLSGKDYDRDRISVDKHFPYAAQVDGFYMAQSEVTNRQYKSFLTENPDWSRENLDTLIADGKVSKGYLAAWEGGDYPDGRDAYPVTGVSFYAARAFGDWLSPLLPESLGGFGVRLPHEEQWEWAVRSSEARAERAGSSGSPVFKNIMQTRSAEDSAPNSLGLKNLVGNVWEWCADWHLPVKNLLVGTRVISPAARDGLMPMGSERVVKGGSWANDEEEIRTYTRGSQPPDWCTPYLGFRVVAVRK